MAGRETHQNPSNYLSPAKDRIWEAFPFLFAIPNFPKKTLHDSYAKSTILPFSHF